MPKQWPPNGAKYYKTKKPIIFMKKKNKVHLSDVLTSLMYTIIFIGSICWLMSCNKPAAKIVNPEYLHGMTLDIPEELTAIKDTSLLRVYRIHDTLFVEFAHAYETDDTNFIDGEVLLPDYVHSDTLIVTDAKFINWAMGNYDAASDGDIYDILKQGTKPLN